MTNKPTAVVAVGNGTAATVDEQWVIDCDITMKEKREFSKLIAKLDPAADVDEATLYPFYAKVVKHWPYAGDPSNVASYDDLRISQMQEVTRRVMAEFQQLTAGVG